MARKVVLEIEANSGTAASALEEVQSRIEQVKRGFTEGGEAASDSFNQIGRSAENAISSIKGMERATQRVFSELVENTGQGVRAIDSMEASLNDLNRRAQISADELRNFRRVQGRVASSGETMRSSLSASSNNLAFELTQAAQDARYGMAGVANQIPLISEQFTQLTAKSGSVSGAFSSLASTFFGPVGIIAGVTLGLPLLQDLFTSMSEGEDDVASLSERLDEASQSFIELKESSQEALQVSTDVASRVLADLEEVVASLESSIQEIAAPQFQLEGAVFGAGDVGMSEADEQRLQQLREELDLNEEAKEQVQEIIDRRELLNTIRQRSAELLSQQTEDSEVVGKLTTEQVQALQQGEASIQTIVAGLQEQVITLEEANSLLDDQLQKYEDIEGRLPSGDVFAIFSAIEEGAVSASEGLGVFADRAEGIDSIIGALDLGVVTQEEAASAAEEWVSGLSDVREQAEAVRRAIEAGLISTEDFSLEVPEGAPTVAETPILDATSGVPETISIDAGEMPSVEQEGNELNRAQQRLADLAIQFRNIESDVDDGFISPLEGARQQVRNLQNQLIAMKSEGVEATAEEIENTEERLKEARREAAGLKLAFEAISGISQSFGEQVAFTIFGEEQRTEQLRSERRQIQQQLREAQRDGDVEQVRELRKELSTVNDRLEAAATLFGRMNQAIERLGNAGVRILKQLTAQLAAAAAKAAILTALSGPLGIAKSFGQLFTSALLGRAGGGPVSGRGGPTADRIPALLSDREFVVQASSAQVAPTALQAMNANTEVASAVESFVQGNVRTFSGGGSPNGRSFASVTARSASAPAERQIHITGEFRQRGTEMRATLDETSTLQRRSGRS